MTSDNLTLSLMEQSLMKHLSAYQDKETKLVKLFEMKTTIRHDKRVSDEGLDTATRFDFQPKAVFFTKDSTGEKKFGILEYSSSALSLKDVGVMQAYARLSNPHYAFSLCSKSVSKELAYILADPVTGYNLMNYKQGQSISLVDIGHDLGL